MTSPAIIFVMTLAFFALKFVEGGNLPMKMPSPDKRGNR